MHRRGKYAAPSRHSYSEPYFDSLAYHGRPKGKHKTAERKKSRTLSIRSSSSSMKAAMANIGSSSTSRQHSLRNKFSGESFESVDYGSAPSQTQGQDREGIDVMVTKPETPSPPSNKQSRAASTPVSSFHRHGTVPANQQVLRPSPSLTFRNQERLAGLQWRLRCVNQARCFLSRLEADLSFWDRWIVVQSGWLMIWKDRTVCDPWQRARPGTDSMFIVRQTLRRVRSQTSCFH